MYAGTYTENLVVNVSVSIVGNGSDVVTVDGDENGDVINVTSPNVLLMGLNVTGAYFTDNGVVLWEVEQVRVRECNVSADAWWGVHVYYSNWTRILNCSITRNDWGIRMFHSNYTRIVGCDISRHRLVDGHAGIWIDDHCNHILIDNNSIYRNAAGIDVRIDMNIPTENLTVRCNDIRLNDNEAVWADHLRSGSIEHNHLHDNLGRGSTCTTPGAALWSAT